MGCGPAERKGTSENLMAAIQPGPIRPPLRSADATSPAAAPFPDFITAYADYADVLEAPREVHEAVAISLVAAVANDLVAIQYGGLDVTLDLWTLILSGSGFGRNTLVSLAYPVLEANGRGGLIRANTWGSGPAFYQDFAEHPNGLCLWPEMSQVLKTLKQTQFMGAKEWLTDRYDNLRAPSSVRYRSTGRASNTPPIDFDSAPRINILATSSLDWLLANLDREDSTGGFLPRWFVVKVGSPSKVISKPRKPDPALVKPLADFLERASKLCGVADLSRVEDLYDSWYQAANARFKQQVNDALGGPFFNRLRALVLKLAVIFEISSSCTLSVSPEAMTRAIDRAADIERTIFELLPTGMTREGFAVDRIEQKVRGAGVAGISLSDLTRAFQDGSKHRDRQDRIKSLLQSGRMASFKRTTSGRPSQIFVHSDFAAQHVKEFPNDSP
jgi:hypothetical protein